MPFEKYFLLKTVVYTVKMLVKNIKRSTLYRILLQKNERNYTTVSIQESVKGFEDFFPSVLGKVPTHCFGTPEVVENVKRVAEYSANEENKLRGSIALLSYELLVRPHNNTTESLNQIRTLAWGAEMVHTYVKILEDMDTYSGKSCWHNHDLSLLRSYIYEILRADFMGKPYYVDLVHLFNKAFLHCTIGNYLEFLSKFRNNSELTMERYNAIVEYKTSFPTFKFPMALTTKMSENIDEKVYREINNIFSDLGKLYHMRNDFLDCYGEENDHLGIPNHSRQIQDGRCTWLAVTALQRLTPTQRIVFSSCYGSKQPAHIERLKLLYDQLQMKKLYKEEKDRIYADIQRKAEKLESNSKLILKVLGLIMNKTSEN